MMPNATSRLTTDTEIFQQLTKTLNGTEGVTMLSSPKDSIHSFFVKQAENQPDCFFSLLYPSEVPDSVEKIVKEPLEDHLKQFLDLAKAKWTIFMPLCQKDKSGDQAHWTLVEITFEINDEGASLDLVSYDPSQSGNRHPAEQILGAIQGVVQGVLTENLAKNRRLPPLKSSISKKTTDQKQSDSQSCGLAICAQVERSLSPDSFHVSVDATQQSNRTTPDEGPTTTAAAFEPVSWMAAAKESQKTVFDTFRLHQLAPTYQRPWWVLGNLTMPAVLVEIVALVPAITLLGIDMVAPGASLLAVDAVAVLLTGASNMAGSRHERNFYAQGQETQETAKKCLDESRSAWHELTQKAGIDKEKLHGFDQLYKAYYHRQALRRELPQCGLSHANFPDDLIALVEDQTHSKRRLQQIERLCSNDQDRPLTAMVKVLTWLALEQEQGPRSQSNGVAVTAIAAEPIEPERDIEMTSVASFTASQADRFFVLIGMVESELSKKFPATATATAEQIDQAFWSLYLQAARKLDANKESWVSMSALNPAKGDSAWTKGEVEAICQQAQILQTQALTQAQLEAANNFWQGPATRSPPQTASLNTVDRTPGHSPAFSSADSSPQAGASGSGTHLDLLAQNKSSAKTNRSPAPPGSGHQREGLA